MTIPTPTTTPMATSTARTSTSTLAAHPSDGTDLIVSVADARHPPHRFGSRPPAPTATRGRGLPLVAGDGGPTVVRPRGDLDLDTAPRLEQVCLAKLAVTRLDTVLDLR